MPEYYYDTKQIDAMIARLMSGEALTDAEARAVPLVLAANQARILLAQLLLNIPVERRVYVAEAIDIAVSYPATS